MAVSNFEWQTIVKSVSLLKKDNVEIETRPAPKNLFANS
jgi:hypothetical protein